LNSDSRSQVAMTELMSPLPQSERVQSVAYPPSLLPSLREIAFVCPWCRGPLEILTDKEGYRCLHCDRDYLLHAGIPDFRVFADPFLSFEEDHERTEIVLAELDRKNLKSLLEYYWTFSDITPVALRPKFVRSAMLGEEKAKRLLRSFENGTFEKPVTARRVLEIGSGTGNFLALAADHYERVIGIDIAMRWLHVSRRRFMDQKLPVPPLVCCCAEYLPFADNSFDLVVSSATLEFVKDQERVLAECARTLKKTGAVYLNTANRFAVSKDPYAYLFGVGFLPRAWQAPYVRWRRDAPYAEVRTLSLRELNRLAKKYFPTREFVLPNVVPEALQHFSAPTRLQMRLYQTVRGLWPFSVLLKRVGPGWDILLRK
jgi:ubiquinone/menaquinone biosynthesis C-methylase UbiE/uncharacterized protein YbaR (Trm112 family)